MNFSVKPITQQFLHFFRIFFPAPVSEFQKILLFEYTRELLEKGQNQQQTQRSHINSVTSGIRVQASLMGGDSCTLCLHYNEPSPWLRSNDQQHPFPPHTNTLDWNESRAKDFRGPKVRWTLRYSTFTSQRFTSGLIRNQCACHQLTQKA